MLRAALKSLLGRKLRLVMSTFAIVLGVAFVAGTLVFSDTLNRSFTALFSSTVGDVVVRPVGGGANELGEFSTVTVPASLVPELAEVPGAARADGNVQAVGVNIIGADGKVIGGFGPPAFGENWTDAPAGHGLQGLTITEGRAPRGPGEIVVDAATLEEAGYDVGDTVPLNTSGKVAELDATLVGVSDFTDGGSLNGASMVSFETRVAQELFLDGADAYSDLWVTAEDGTSQEELRDRVAPLLPDGLEAVTGDEASDESASELLEAISFLTTFLLIFAGISLVVGAFLIVNTFSILVAQRSRELALLRALGASKRQVLGSVQLEALVLGLLGSTLGLGLGVLLAIALRAVFARVGLDLSGQALVFLPRTAAAAYLIGVVVTLVAAFLPALRSTRIAPVQALRDDVVLPESSIHRRLQVGVLLVVVGLLALASGLGFLLDVPRDGWFVGGGVLAILLGVAAASPVISRPFLAAAAAAYTRLFGTVGTLAGQNSLRNPRRTTATASALMIGLTLACTMAIVGASAKASVDRSVEENFVGDYIVSNVVGGSFSPEIAGRMAEVPGVEQVVRQRYGGGQVDGDFQGITGSDPGSAEFLELDVTRGSPDLRDGTVLLERDWAEERGLGVGDTVDVVVPTGARQWEVVGVFEENPVVFFPVLTTIDTLLAAGAQDKDNALIVDVDGSAGVQDRLEETVAGSPVITVKDQNEFAAEQRAPIDRFVLLIFALLALALLIAVLGIVNTLALSVIERTREVGLLRAVGLSRRQLRRMITLESVVISVLGAVLGVVLGVFFGVALMYALRDEGLEVIEVPVGQLAIFLAASVVVGVLAAVLPARRAARLDVLRAIATE